MALRKMIRLFFLLLPVYAAFISSGICSQEEDHDDDVAFARAGQTWKVVETVGRDRWVATWTLRPDGRSFDALWKHTPGGDEGSMMNFARIRTISGNKIIIDRPGLGQYTGTISSDGRRINGRVSWSQGKWDVAIEGGTLKDPAPTATSKASLAGQSWQVVETAGSDRWNATWKVRADGRSFDAHWVHEPGGDEGDLRNFARIVSISGNSITIDRPGLGKYSGTISPDRKRISGRTLWAGGKWEVRLLGNAALPDKLPK